MKKNAHAKQPDQDIDSGVLRLLASESDKRSNLAHAEALLVAINKAGSALAACRNELRTEVVQPGPHSAPVRTASSWVREVVVPAVHALHELDKQLGGGAGAIVTTPLAPHISANWRQPASVAQGLFVRLYLAHASDEELLRTEASFTRAFDALPDFRSSTEYWLRLPTHITGELHAVVVNHAAEDRSVQLEHARGYLASLNTERVNAPTPTPPRRGRPRTKDRDDDARIYAAWKTGAHRPFAAFATTLGRSESSVHSACERHRKYLASQKKVGKTSSNVH